MKITSVYWTPQAGWDRRLADASASTSLVLYFAATEVAELKNGPIQELQQTFPHAIVVGCTSAGEIFQTSVRDGGLSAACVSFDSTTLRAEWMDSVASGDSHRVGEELALRLNSPELRYVLVLSDGLQVNGSKLIEGLRRNLPPSTCVSGGLAGDGSRFGKTLVGVGSQVAPNRVVAVGFYGTSLKVGHGSAGGWQPFGPVRRITQSRGNVLLALDDQPALALYKRYLADLASGLPATGLLFPLQLLASKDDTQGVVRTILAVNDADQSLTFAGDMPVGSYARLMKAGCDALVDGAELAAERAVSAESAGERLAILVSCVGRKLVMKQRVEEEVEAVLARLGAGVSGIGFYSYGEICPTDLVHGCEFHNQTMTLTVLSEAQAGRG